MQTSATTRRSFLKLGATLTTGTCLAPGWAAAASPVLPKSSRPPAPDVIGHGDFRYRVHRNWGALDAARTPVINCHEMVQDRKGRLLMITDEPKNNIIIYDRSGKLLATWTLQLPGGHGLTLADEGDGEVLWLCDPQEGKVLKTTLAGKSIRTLPTPHELGLYTQDMPYKPTETAVAPNGDVYVADGYGSQFVLQFDAQGHFLRHFGGKGNDDAQFDTVHGVTIDTRQGAPTLLCTSRVHNAFKRFTLAGEYLETIFLPGAFVCRPVIDGDTLYAGVCWSRLRYLNQTPDSGFVTILDRQNRVVSNPGGTPPRYDGDELQLMVQAQPVFKHCHDVCVDRDQNLYVCQWNADHTYPIMLERI
ncbi:hypothetical protein SAMN05421823_101374 [Catalinimonas alkaloidigena]|uniref:Tat (Twin-arginine translocation) pathway signal sequence n=1 Tax=Catalinimonas alkaloidigena TaxID=1075417 RepID=A0A1G8XJZ0_9BACT|nr:6-bladed beta-propeller [Catalinimonas alkaloidigena]SDJ90205.1 hypothetical protein SAMN05421823_101374 [Catalinimonas alkaloidigena]